jgi:hypothetical protein
MAPLSLWDENEERLVRYLLGDLPPEELAALDERLFVEPNFYDEVMATSDELIRAYLVDKLSPEDRARFEAHFLASPHQRQRLSFLKDMLAAMPGSVRAKPRADDRAAWWRWAALAAAALLIVSLLYYWRPPSGPEQQARGSTPTPAPTSVPTATPATPLPVQPTPPSPRVRSAPTAPAETRMVSLPSAPQGPVDVSLVGARDVVHLQVPIPAGANPTYAAELRNAAGDAVWQASALVPEASGDRLTLEVPTRLLVADAYDLQVRSERYRDNPRPAVAVHYTLHVRR